MFFAFLRANTSRIYQGRGAEKYGGRWNRPGIPVLYTSESRALAMLELMVHFSSISSLKKDYQFVEILLPRESILDITEEVTELDLYTPNNSKLWKWADEHFLNGNILAIRVPSVLVPFEFNYLLNTQHQKYSELSVLGFHEAFYDKSFMNSIHLYSKK